MRTSAVILSIGMTAMLLGCSLFNDGQKADGAAPPTVAPPPSATTPASVASSSIGYDGPRSLEARILASPVIARIRLDSVSSAAESGPTVRGTKYILLLEFRFSVLEYLKGSGGNDIVAVWNADQLFDTRREAEAALPAIATARDTRWDDHEAIVFLKHSQTYLTSTQQAGRFYLSGVTLGSFGIDDNYSLVSRHNKLWLPAEAAVSAPSQPSGDQQRFLMDVPPAMGTAPTITLGEMKARIAAVTAKLNAGDDSDEYRECLSRTYYYQGISRYRMATEGRSFYISAPSDHELDSSLAASTVMYEDLDLGGLPNILDELWLDGGDADLFSVEFGYPVPHDFSGDGVNDSIQYARRVVSARPTPEGVYRFHFNHRDGHFVLCNGYTVRYEWTVTVNAPDGALHEFFFDPVTDGAAVAADDTNGVLKPASFTDANGASATINRIAWESPSTSSGQAGTVKLSVTPRAGLANHIVEFIEMDGAMSLFLDVADATVDATTDTLSWSVSSQPWEDGDKLMVRIREARP